MASDQKEKCEIKSLEKVDIGSFETAERVLKVLANKTSLAIVSVILRQGEACACELEPALGIAQPVVTSHLRKLYHARLLTKRDQWRYTFYSLDNDFKDFVKSIVSLSSSAV